MDQLLDEQAGHDGLAGTRVVGEEEAQRLAASVRAEAVPSHDAFVQLPRGPVPEQATGVQQVVEQSDAGDAARPGRHRGGQRRQHAASHGGIEQFGLLREVAVGRGGQVLLDRRQVVELKSDGEMVGVVQAGLGAQQPVALLVLLDVGARSSSTP